MENGVQKWRFKGNESITTASGITVRGVLNMLMENLHPDDERQVLALGHGDPSHFPSFCTSPLAVDAVVEALRSFRFNCYGSTVGILPARNTLINGPTRFECNALRRGGKHSINSSNVGPCYCGHVIWGV